MSEVALARLHLQRKKAGVCRHCGGPVPCWSSFGDQAVGVKHTDASYRAMTRVRPPR
jgi:hypothetical protein